MTTYLRANLSLQGEDLGGDGVTQVCYDAAIRAIALGFDVPGSYAISYWLHTIQALQLSSKKQSPSAGPAGPRLTGLSPIYHAECRILILGSFPSPASLAAGQYYGHPQNQFWPLLAAASNKPLPAQYAGRVELALAQQIAIWDVYQSCVRPGSLDADIRAGSSNDFAALFLQMPRLQRLCFNGQTAGKCAPRLLRLAASILSDPPEIRILPSSSPAYTIAFARKLKLWQEALNLSA